jgi:predicted site-specific integrase-resolvase
MTSTLPEDIKMNGNYKKVEVAKILGIGRTTLDNHIKDGVIKINYHRYTKRLTIKGSEIIRFFNSRL